MLDNPVTDRGRKKSILQLIHPLASSNFKCLEDPNGYSPSLSPPPTNFFFSCLFFFLWPHSRHTDVPRLGANQSHSCRPTPQQCSLDFKLPHSSWQCWILNPLSEVMDGTCNLMVSSWIHFRCAMMGTPSSYQLNQMQLGLLRPVMLGQPPSSDPNSPHHAISALGRLRACFIFFIP